MSDLRRLCLLENFEKNKNILARGGHGPGWAQNWRDQTRPVYKVIGAGRIWTFVEMEPDLTLAHFKWAGSYEPRVLFFFFFFNFVRT